jgi:hypothetical protein
VGEPLTTTQGYRSSAGLTVVNVVRKIVNALNAMSSVNGIELN